MLRTLQILLGLTGLASFAPADEFELKSGIPAMGELTSKDTNAFEGFAIKGYAREYTVHLKAGQSITISASVLGVNRLVGVAIFDPEGRPIEATRELKNAVKATKIVVEEVNATGEYKVYVGSEKIGAYTLKAEFKTPPEVEREQLEARLKQLKAETATVEARLKVLKESKK
jgi:hypothetical protein